MGQKNRGLFGNPFKRPLGCTRSHSSCDNSPLSRSSQSLVSANPRVEKESRIGAGVLAVAAVATWLVLGFFGGWDGFVKGVQSGKPWLPVWVGGNLGVEPLAFVEGTEECSPWNGPWFPRSPNQPSRNDTQCSLSFKHAFLSTSGWR